MKAWIDVGGTFTDCFVVTAAGKRLRRKVLSSGITKASIAGGSTAERLLLPSRRGDGDDFWVGSQLLVLDETGHELTRRSIVAFASDAGAFTLDEPLAELPAAGTVVELHSPWEAPVLAVRLALQLGGSRQGDARPLPACDVRLGTTRGTNALLTRSGADVALLVTAGFCDLLRIGSQERPDLFTLDICKPPPLTDRVVEVQERLAADGSVLIPLDLAKLKADLEALRNDGAASLAICLLHAFRNDQHEQQVAELARQVGFQEISLSSQVAPLIKLLTRAETTTLDAYLNPILATYIERVWQQFGGPQTSRLRLMTSGGQLVGGQTFRGRDCVLSGPAGGVVALAAIGDSVQKIEQRVDGVIGFDMGGTSTDVSRYEGQIVRQFEARKAGVRVMTPMMAIHTVAAGGGSICHSQAGRLLVGPESAGADPGPACYGRGGPLAVTDLNLILGRIVEQYFPFPLDHQAVHQRLETLRDHLSSQGVSFASPTALAEGYWQIAVNHMAEAVRTVTTAAGSDPSKMALVSFGGAAGQHACAVAEALDIGCVIDHPDASMLSALGMGLAPVGRFASRGIYQPLDSLAGDQLSNWEAELIAETSEQLAAEEQVDLSASSANCQIRSTAELRYLGTEAALQLELQPISTLNTRFANLHQHLFGYQRAERSVELVTLRVDAEIRSTETIPINLPPSPKLRQSSDVHPLYARGTWQDAKRFSREQLQPGDLITGPALIASATSTLVVQRDWQALVCDQGTIIVRRDSASTDRQIPSQASTVKSIPTDQQPVLLEIAARRLEGIAEQMGEALRRTAVSVNVKERLDYSCAVFRRDGSLVAGAMHVPVHLGAMGHTVRSIMAAYPTMDRGDCYVSNNPYAGGSHLPDVTVVTPVFVSSERGSADFFVASRAHHAEIGGLTPGSMPPNARSLGEEGIVIHNFPLHQAGVAREAELETLLRSGPYPSRAPHENMADIAAQVAAGRQGAEDIRALAQRYGATQLDDWMQQLLSLSADSLDELIAELGDKPRHFSDCLLDDAKIAVRLQVAEEKLIVDFAGTSSAHQHGWNATPAIVSAAVLYVLRCLSKRPLPLSEGILRRLELRIPTGLLNPRCQLPFELCPAVVAGNVETSQRIVDCLLGALGVAAASQGTMNNLLIGDASFGYYETICGGSGATSRQAGADAVHTHMTNTRITDPEILESRYPLRLWEFSIRRGSGGEGQQVGGNGVIRELEALAPLTASLLTSRRQTPAPYGIDSGQPGACGRNVLIKQSQPATELPATATIELQPGDRLRIETPGGGGAGAAE